VLSFNIEKRRSYLICFGFTNEDLAQLELASENSGYNVINCKTVDELKESFNLVQHCLGLFAQSSGDSKVDAELIDLATTNNTDIKFFSGGSHIPANLRAPQNLSLADYTSAFITDIVPQKFKELCLFSIKKVTANLIPDYATEWKISLQPPSSANMNFLIFCESVFDGFICAMTVRSDLNYVTSKSETLKDMSEQDIIEYYSEVCNQVLGVININLKKINIYSKIGLPIVVRDEGIAEFKRRSSYFLPSFTMTDDDGGLNITFQFLVPFLKNTGFLRNLDFDVGNVPQDKKVQIL
jgi:hypothetical protein